MADPTITGTGAVKRAEFKRNPLSGSSRVIALKSCRWS